MRDAPIAANYCPEGCYWPCEHRAAAATPEAAWAAREHEGRWQLGPDPGDDPEQLALDEWRLWSVAGIAPGHGFARRQFCSDCGRPFTDAAEHAHEHARRRQLGLEL